MNNDKMNISSNEMKKTRVIAVSSGKGGVGKTLVALGLGMALSSAKKDVLLVDADLGTANLNVALGIPVEYNLWDMVKGRINVDGAIVNIEEHLDLLPGVSGIYEATFWRMRDTEKLWRELDLSLAKYNYVIIDTGSGIGNGVIQFDMAADEVVVVFTPEATSITDAYALVKTLHKEGYDGNIYAIENMVKRQQSDFVLALSLKTMAQRFLSRDIEILGTIPYDAEISKKVRYQELGKYLHEADDFMFYVRSVAKNLLKNGDDIGSYRPSFWTKLRTRLSNILGG
jgi:flagellar biosynthesis protein FlhG